MAPSAKLARLALPDPWHGDLWRRNGRRAITDQMHDIIEETRTGYRI